MLHFRRPGVDSVESLPAALSVILANWHSMTLVGIWFELDYKIFTKSLAYQCRKSNRI
jgi:hypothetical protein